MTKKTGSVSTLGAMLIGFVALAATPQAFALEAPGAGDAAKAMGEAAVDKAKGAAVESASETTKKTVVEEVHKPASDAPKASEGTTTRTETTTTTTETTATDDAEKPAAEKKPAKSGKKKRRAKN